MLRQTMHLAPALLLSLLVAACGDDNGATADPAGTTQAQDVVADTAVSDAAVTDTSGADADVVPPTDTAPPVDVDTAAPTDTAAPDAADTGAPADADVTDARDADATGSACPRALRPAEGTRRFVVSHPYDGDEAKGWAYRVGTVSADGATVDPAGATFRLGGRALDRHIAFTPDGAVGLVVMNNGELGVFGLSDEGAPTVIDALVDTDVYAGAVSVSADGASAWILDNQWEVHGGGVYVAAIGCDGELGPTRLVAGGMLPAAMAWIDGGDGRAVIAATSLLGSPAGESVHLVDLDGAAPRRIASVDAFGDEDFIVSATALTHDGGQLLVADYSAFGVGNRVAVVAVDGDALSPVQVLDDLEDPIDVVTSPFDRTALVVSGYGDALMQLDHSPGGGAPWSNAGELTYTGGRPQLPTAAVVVRRGAAAGVVLVTENQGVRHLRFTAGGDVTDYGRIPNGSGIAAITGAIGVQP